MQCRFHLREPPGQHDLYLSLLFWYCFCLGSVLAGGTVFELRAVEEPDPTYHHLAEVCGLEYHLLFVEGREERRAGPACG